MMLTNFQLGFVKIAGAPGGIYNINGLIRSFWYILKYGVDEMLTKLERAIIQEFNSLKIPAIYKTDNTFNILYIEHIYFDICPFLLKNQNKGINIGKERIAYSSFLANISISDFDEEAKYHLSLLQRVMSILFKQVS